MRCFVNAIETIDTETLKSEALRLRAIVAALDAEVAQRDKLQMQQGWGWQEANRWYWFENVAEAVQEIEKIHGTDARYRIVCVWAVPPKKILEITS